MSDKGRLTKGPAGGILLLMAKDPTHRPKYISNGKIAGALIASGGLLSPAAEALGCTRSNVFNRIASCPWLQEQLKIAKERVLDMAESKLMTNIKEQDQRAIEFYLKNQGRDRGYMDREDINIKREEIIVIGPEQKPEDPPTNPDPESPPV